MMNAAYEKLARLAWMYDLELADFSGEPCLKAPGRHVHRSARHIVHAYGERIRTSNGVDLDPREVTLYVKMFRDALGACPAGQQAHVSPMDILSQLRRGKAGTEIQR
jgi:hypothetical protein